MCSKFTVFYSVLILIFVSFESSALKSGDKGVCNHYISSIITKKVYHTKLNKLKRCKGKPCVVKFPKIEKTTQRKSQLVCCSGWQYDSVSDSCKPVCSTGCLNGTCVAPSICECNPPLYLEPTKRNVCKPPSCEPLCGDNSECVAPNVCSCFEGYKTKEDRCVSEETGENLNCETGFRNVDGLCVPVCDKDCVNGECSAPNTCTCFEGYHKNETHTEVCSRECLPQCNAVCDSHGQCPDVACEPFKKFNV